MIKSIIKIAIAILIANAIFQIAAEYVNHYRFNDAVLELATHSVGKTDSQLKDKVMDLAATYSEPVDPETLTIRQDEHHTFVEAKYTKAIAVVPGYEVQWPFALDVDGFVIVPTKAGDLLPNPK
jgi:hypothetical protein